MSAIDDEFFAAQDKRMEISDEEVEDFLARRADWRRRRKLVQTTGFAADARQADDDFAGEDPNPDHSFKRRKVDSVIPGPHDTFAQYEPSSNQPHVLDISRSKPAASAFSPSLSQHESHLRGPDTKTQKKGATPESVADDRPPNTSDKTFVPAIPKERMPAIASNAPSIESTSGKRTRPTSNLGVFKAPKNVISQPLQNHSPIEEMSINVHIPSEITKVARSNPDGRGLTPSSNDHKRNTKLFIKRKLLLLNSLEITSTSNKNSMTSIPPESSPIEQMSELIESDSASLPQAASAQSIITVSAPDQPLHPEVPSKISNPSGVRRREKVLKTTFNRGVDGGNISDPLNSTPIIQDFSSSSSSRPGVLPPVPAPTKGLSNPTTKSKMPTGNASNITTPDNSILDIQYAPSSSSIVAGPSKKRKLQPEPQSDTKAKAKGNKKTKVRPQLVTPFEYAQKLQEKMMLPADKKPSQGVFKYLKGKKIFYIGGDMQYAGERTRGRMDYIVKYGGTVLPTYDPSIVTHIVTDAPRKSTLRAVGLKSLGEIPDHIPTVTWSWVISGRKRIPLRKKMTEKEGKEQDSEEEEEVEMDEVCMHAAFVERFDAGMEKFRRPWEGKGKGKAKEKASVNSKGKGMGVDDSGEISRISEFTPEKIRRSRGPSIQDSDAEDTGEDHGPTTSLPSPQAHLKIIEREASNTPENAEVKAVADDPLAEFYAQARAELDENPIHDTEEDSDADGFESDQDSYDAVPQPIPRRGFTCDIQEVQPRQSVNQDIVDKLQELMEIHKAKPSMDDHWRAFSYGKCLRAIRNHPTRIKSYREARSIRGVGEKTALKIMEILQTGNLRRIGYEKTEDVEATHLFQGIYGVGMQNHQSTAFKWYANGCRTLEDIRARKGGIKLNAGQEIGLQFYDDLNTRMPRSEAEAIFDIIKPIALRLDPRLFVEIMGSFRRGKADCGDIDILITRPVDDGKTHAGILAPLFRELHAIGILTEDLSVPEDCNDLEAVYHGLCCLPVEGSRRRRIDFLTVPWASKGAALLYYTGDDIFNRAIRFKARKMGYSLNQRGLFDQVVRDPRDRKVKLNPGKILASETEEEIFAILGVPWQEPHQRVRH